MVHLLHQHQQPFQQDISSKCTSDEQPEDLPAEEQLPTQQGRQGDMT